MKKLLFFIVLLSIGNCLYASKLQEITPEEHAKIIALIIRSKL